jgi:murein DD-endopeptidase MepM/ murein hydrolase activator NlpD
MKSGGQILSGPEVQRGERFSGPAVLAVLECSGWIRQTARETIEFPIGIKDSWRKDYITIAWAANNLNRGYYLWRVNGIRLAYRRIIIPIAPSCRTAGVQQFFALIYDRTGWDYTVSTDGLFTTYSNFFGYPFDYAIEPVIPQNLEQPAMQLPFEPNVDWAFTGGPHGGWGDGSAGAALDFAPAGEGLGCIPSDLWVVAVADGLIIRTDQGRVIQDLDHDGNEGTGWIVLYMHIEERDRVQPSTYLKAGERIGHPSCEGGFSTGTHTHLARRYNGEWIPADQAQVDYGVPLLWMAGYPAKWYRIRRYLERDGESVEA